MKIGMRKPSIKISQCQNYWKGKKGSGWIKDPKKAAYKKVYKKTTFSFWDLNKKSTLAARPRTQMCKELR